MTDCVHLYVFDCQNFVSEKDYRAMMQLAEGFRLERNIMQQQAMDAQMALGAMAKAFNEAVARLEQQLATCRREFFEYRKVAWENEEIGHKALDDLLKAREAGRREGLQLHKEAWGALNFILAFYDSDANRYLDTNAWKNAEASGRRVRAKLRALIDSPKARRSPYDFACPRCSVPHGETCINDGTLHRKEFHVSRRELADEANLKSIDSPKAEGEKPPKMLYVAFDCLGNPYAVSTRPEHIACDPARIKPYVPVEAEGEEKYDGQ